MFELRGQNVLNTGGNRGIGLAFAIALAEAGAAIYLAQRNTFNTSAADAVRAKGGKAQIVACDLANMAQVKTVFDEALNTMGGEFISWSTTEQCRCHHERVFAESDRRRVGHSRTFSRWWFAQTPRIADGCALEEVTEVNIKSHFLICQSAGKHMVPLRRGKIINVFSIMDTIGGEGIINHCLENWFI